LVACNEATPLFKKKPASSATTTAPKAAAKFSEKDVEAPQVFQKTSKALWDGRPSLGGVWVAHPDNKKPERVIIRNKANGKSVIGALFNRERSLPGPAFQLSSDAAIALGVPAGSTTELSVTAMRVEKTPIVKKSDAPKAAPSEDIASATLKSLDETADPKAEPTDQPQKKISKWKARKLAREAEKAAATTGEVATKTLPKPPLRDGRKPASTSAEKTSKAAAKTTKPVTKAEVAPVTKPSAPAPKAPVAGGKYAQLGLFSVESNAKATLAKVKAKNLSGKIVAGDSNGKKYYRVLAGPAASASEQKKILSIVKSMGFSDAYLVKG
jgi:hypothetical protein